jgi:hypothetical protein
MECKSNVRFVMSVLDDLDCDLLSALEDLIDDGELEKGSNEHGIALQVALRGYGSLSLKQQCLFNTKVVPLVEEYDEERYWDERAVIAPV